MLMKIIDTNSNNVVQVCSVFNSMKVTLKDIAETSLILNRFKFFNTVNTFYSTTFNNDGYFFIFIYAFKGINQNTRLPCFIKDT